MKQKIVAANIHLNEKGNLFSPDYDDVYASNAGAQAESDYNFIQANQLPQRFQQLKPHQRFCIGETGFGTGLNFFLTAQCFQQFAPKQAQLYYFSAEKHPFKKDDLQSILKNWPQFAELSQAVISQYPSLIPGFHTIEINNIKLTLLFDDAADAFAQLHANMDAWFLDGFAPQKNPQMWDDALFSQIARLSQLNTSYSTFTTARIVKDQLKAKGFTLKKRPGFAHKREMLTGSFIGQIGPMAPKSNQFFQPSSCIAEPENHPLRIAIIGGGIAGCASAFALKKRHANVTIFEQHSQLAQEASGNPQAALYLKPGSELSYNNRFYLHAFEQTTQQFHRGLPIDDCGFLQLQHNAKEAQKQQELIASQLYPDDFMQLLTAEQASQQAGITVPQPALLYKQAGKANPKQLCQFWQQGCEIAGEQKVTALIPLANNQWQLQFANDSQYSQHVFDYVVVCNANAATQFSQLAHLPLKSIRGQVTTHPHTLKCQSLKRVVCGEHYITPSSDDQMVFGAAFDLNDDDSAVRVSDHQKNIDNISHMQVSQRICCAAKPR